MWLHDSWLWEPKLDMVKSWAGKGSEHPFLSSSLQMGAAHVISTRRLRRAVFAYSSQLGSQRPVKSCQRLAVPWTASHTNRVGAPLTKRCPWLLKGESGLPTKPQALPGLEVPNPKTSVRVVLLLCNLVQQTHKNLDSSISDLPITPVGHKLEKIETRNYRGRAG